MVRRTVSKVWVVLLVVSVVIVSAVDGLNQDASRIVNGLNRILLADGDEIKPPRHKPPQPMPLPQLAKGAQSKGPAKRTQPRGPPPRPNANLQPPDSRRSSTIQTGTGSQGSSSGTRNRKALIIHDFQVRNIDAKFKDPIERDAKMTSYMADINKALADNSYNYLFYVTDETLDDNKIDINYVKPNKLYTCDKSDSGSSSSSEKSQKTDSESNEDESNKSVECIEYAKGKQVEHFEHTMYHNSQSKYSLTIDPEKLSIIYVKTGKINEELLNEISRLKKLNKDTKTATIDFDIIGFHFTEQQFKDLCSKLGSKKTRCQLTKVMNQGDEHYSSSGLALSNLFVKEKELQDVRTIASVGHKFKHHVTTQSNLDYVIYQVTDDDKLIEGLCVDDNNVRSIYLIDNQTSTIAKKADTKKYHNDNCNKPIQLDKIKKVDLIYVKNDDSKSEHFMEAMVKLGYNINNYGSYKPFFIKYIRPTQRKGNLFKGIFHKVVSPQLQGLLNYGLEINFVQKDTKALEEVTFNDFKITTKYDFVIFNINNYQTIDGSFNKIIIPPICKVPKVQVIRDGINVEKNVNMDKMKQNHDSNQCIETIKGNIPKVIYVFYDQPMQGGTKYNMKQMDEAAGTYPANLREVQWDTIGLKYDNSKEGFNELPIDKYSSKQSVDDYVNSVSTGNKKYYETKYQEIMKDKQHFVKLMEKLEKLDVRKQ